MRNPKKTIILVAVLLLLAGIYIGIRYHVDRSVEQSVNREIEKISSFADIHYKSVDFDWLRKRIRLQAVRLSPKLLDDRIIIDELILSKTGNASDAGESIHVRVDGIRMDPIQPGGILKTYFTDLGYENIRAKLEFSGSYNRRNKILELTRFEMKVPQLANTAITLRLENIDLDQVAPLPTNGVTLLTMLSGASIGGAELRYQDGSLLEKIYESRARRSGQTVENYIQTINDRIDRIFENPADPTIRKMLDTLHNFISAPGTITIRLQPERPVSVLSLILIKEPDRILKLLGVEVST